MLKNYLVTTLRNLMKHKGFSFINIMGLALAFLVCILIFLWCRYELSFDKNNQNYRWIYRVNTEFHLSNETERYTSCPEPAGPTLVEEFPEITHTARLYGTSGLMIHNDMKFNESNVVFTDPEFFDLFPVETIRGDRSEFLKDPYSMVITQSMGEKYFGNENPVGKVITRNGRWNYTISGVIADFPENTSYQYDFFLSINLFYELEVDFVGSWGNISGQTLIMTMPGIDPDELNEKVWNVANEHSPEAKVCNLWLQPLSKIHLHDLEGGGPIQYVYIFAAIGLIVLLIACINFMNLSTAHSSLRAREVGMRKISGAGKQQIVRQFFGESILISLLAMILAVIVLELLINSFEEFARITVDFSWQQDYILIPVIFLVVIFTGILAGSYPALFISSYHPVDVIKGMNERGKKGSVFRRILVVSQFSLAIIFIICTLIVYKQLSFLNKRDLGFNKDNIIYMRIRGELNEKYLEFKQQLLKNPGIVSVTRSSSTLAEYGLVASSLDWEGRAEEDDPIFSFECVDYDYIETFQLKMSAGRSFSENFKEDQNNYLLNESAVKRIGYKDPIDRYFSMWGTEGRIIGVVKDYSFKSATQGIDPMFLTYIPEYFNYISVRILPGNIDKVLDDMEKTWKEFVDLYPFSYHFLDEDFDRMYQFEAKMGTLFRIFTIMAVFISCLGLLGLTSFSVERRKKEIGIRKVMGASALELLFMMIRDFTKWVLLANLIAWPLAWYAMKNWLQNYAFQVRMSYISFLYASLLAFFIAVFTVFFHTYKATSENPVNTLKYE